MTITYQAALVAHRFGLGPRPGELQAIAADPVHWLKAQLAPDIVTPASLAGLPRTTDVGAELEELRDAKKAGDPVERLKAVVQPHYQRFVAARYRAATETTQPFRERLVHFWSNHFAISADKKFLAAMVGPFEQEAIRPHVTGHFADLLRSAVSHPAMVLYLDNQVSVGPHSVLARRAKQFRDRDLGLNENLAREILELHTLGVGGGYSQTDVTSFARVLTGWSVGGGAGPRRQGTPGAFLFRENAHEPGTATVLGNAYDQEGQAQPQAVLTDLARHPSTATFLARKLARHFLADDPPDDLVATLAKRYRETDGHLPSVYGALIDDERLQTTHPSKLKTPHEFAIACMRAFDFVPQRPQALSGGLKLMGQPVYTPGSPAGWPDVAAPWSGADALLKRVEWAQQVARHVAPGHPPDVLVEQSLGPLADDPLRFAVSRAESAVQALTLSMASPAFLRR